MFILSEIRDTVALQPHTFGFEPADILARELNKKYANRILQDIGLVVSVFDLTKCGEGKIRYGDGCVWYKVDFRLVVFRPFISEVLIGKVKSQDEEGIKLTLTFFDEIYIDKTQLPAPCAYDSSKQQFFWAPKLEADATRTQLMDMPLSERLYIELEAPIRFRVEGDEFYDEEPGPPKATEGVRIDLTREPKRAPYQIFASITGQGMGPLEWWAGVGQSEEQMED
ncbi:DNA-directed RNA polymerase III subunit rpc25 [Serendipita sp. 401]|nr:DNA-directed RNA polymerase III subunit rpc25 [Serendipita sp. 397]KAG8828699.1 DNA-directed RNA polymerase III subunit rpc25 [Serendipita sp. 401]KAG9058850.1 DNA-directed RNA polymerase III subunit rpc25 [Serendipita sp. 407]